MLPYALAIIVGLTSSILFLTAFFLPDIHRQDDFLWSAVGLFYAVVLWFCATSIGGAVLLGQIAVVALLTAYFWQMLKLRKAILYPEQRANLDSFSIVSSLKNLFSRSPKAENSAPLEDEGDTVIETKNESSGKEAPELETVTDEIEDTVIETKEEPVVIKKVNLKSSSKKIAEDNPQTSEEVSPLTNLSETNLNELLDDSENIETDVADDSKTAESPQKKEESNHDLEDEPQDKPLESEAAKTEPDSSQSEITEIKVEQVKVVQEETNWDDEIEDIPASAVKVVETEVIENSNDENQDEAQTSED